MGVDTEGRGSVQVSPVIIHGRGLFQKLRKYSRAPETALVQKWLAGWHFKSFFKVDVLDFVSQ